MKLHRGRMIDHLHLRAADLAASARFYAATLDVLGIPYVSDERHFGADELWIDARGETGEASHVHLAFQAEGPEQVRAWHAAGLAAGGRDNGAPGERPYHPGYFAAFLLDPDGNNVEAVFHGPARRSAPSVEVSFEGPS
jgi:catechol 2,3-dioxygenase-like lactoylglutathione lyase family enzyme